MTDFHDLYQSYSVDIYRFALYLTADKDEAEDIVAECFVRAIHSKVPLQPVSVKAYLLRIARNLHLENLRKNKRLTELPTDLSDENENQLTRLSHKSELEAVFSYLQTCNEVDRAAFLLRIDGLSYDEIAEILELSLSSTKVKVHRIRQKLIAWRNSEI